MAKLFQATFSFCLSLLSFAADFFGILLLRIFHSTPLFDRAPSLGLEGCAGGREAVNDPHMERLITMEEEESTFDL